MVRNCHYYRDTIYELELNLQRIRRELIRLLEESEIRECFVCNRLRCACIDSSKTSTLSCLTDVSSGTGSINGNEESPEAPAADQLPKPEFIQDLGNSKQEGIEAWVRASTPNANVRQDGGYGTKSIWDEWGEEKLKIEETRDPVEAFFKSFGEAHAVGS